MLLTPLFAVLALEGGTTGSITNRETDLIRARAYVAEYSARLSAAHRNIPAWARKYNVNCSTCHLPVVPRLNETGQRFKWAGYRMPDEIGENVEVSKIQNYLAAGINVEYDWQKTEGDVTTANGFAVPGVTIFYGGPIGRHMGAFLQLENGPDGLERTAQVSFMWGKEKSYGGFRAGQMNYLVEAGLAGFDRTPGINAPLPVDGPVTNGVPFSLGEKQLGLEAFYVAGSNRLSAEILNGITADGAGAPAEAKISKDFLITDQYLFDHNGSGIQGAAYYGTVRGLDSSGTNLTLDSHYWRLGLTANKYFNNNFEVLGALVYGRDTDLPVGGTSQFADSVAKGLGWWLSAQYSVVKEKETKVTMYGRYEQVNPNTAGIDLTNRRFVLGMVMPVNLPQYLRWAVEYHRDFPQGGVPRTNAISTHLWLNF